MKRLPDAKWGKATVLVRDELTVDPKRMWGSLSGADARKYSWLLNMI